MIIAQGQLLGVGKYIIVESVNFFSFGLDILQLMLNLTLSEINKLPKKQTSTMIQVFHTQYDKALEPSFFTKNPLSCFEIISSWMC